MTRRVVMPFDLHAYARELIAPHAPKAKALNGNRAGREAYERAVDQELAERGLRNESVDLTCCYYSGMSVDEAVAEVVRCERGGA